MMPRADAPRSSWPTAAWTRPPRSTIDLRGIGGTRLLAATTLHAGDGQDRHATNRDDHTAVVPAALKNAQVTDGRLTAQLPPLSWTVFEMEARRAS